MAAPPISERHRPHFHRKAPVLESVRVATTANITIATALNSGDTLDGITLATDDRVLVKNQSSASGNGIYTVGVTPVRAYDLSTDDPAFGFLVFVREGTANAQTLWRNTNTSAPTIDSTSIAFALATGTPSLALDDLSDVVITSAAAGQKLRFNGTSWVNVVTWHEPQFDYTGSAILDGAGNPIMVEVLS